MTKTEKILKLLEDNGLCIYDLTRAWFELHIDDFMARCTDYENVRLTEEEYNEVIDDVTSDDEMWDKIDDTIDYFIKHDVDLERKGEEDND